MATLEELDRVGAPPVDEAARPDSDGSSRLPESRFSADGAQITRSAEEAARLDPNKYKLDRYFGPLQEAKVTNVIVKAAEFYAGNPDQEHVGDNERVHKEIATEFSHLIGTEHMGNMIDGNFVPSYYEGGVSTGKPLHPFNTREANKASGFIEQEDGTLVADKNSLGYKFLIKSVGKILDLYTQCEGLFPPGFDVEHNIAMASSFLQMLEEDAQIVEPHEFHGILSDMLHDLGHVGQRLHYRALGTQPPVDMHNKFSFLIAQELMQGTLDEVVKDQEEAGIAIESTSEIALQMICLRNLDSILNHEHRTIKADNNLWKRTAAVTSTNEMGTRGVIDAISNAVLYEGASLQPNLAPDHNVNIAPLEPGHEHRSLIRELEYRMRNPVYKDLQGASSAEVKDETMASAQVLMMLTMGDEVAKMQNESRQGSALKGIFESDSDLNVSDLRELKGELKKKADKKELIDGLKNLYDQSNTNKDRKVIKREAVALFQKAIAQAEGSDRKNLEDLLGILKSKNAEFIGGVVLKMAEDLKNENVFDNLHKEVRNQVNRIPVGRQLLNDLQTLDLQVENKAGQSIKKDAIALLENSIAEIEDGYKGTLQQMKKDLEAEEADKFKGTLIAEKYNELLESGIDKVNRSTLITEAEGVISSCSMWKIWTREASKPIEKINKLFLATFYPEIVRWKLGTQSKDRLPPFGDVEEWRNQEGLRNQFGGDNQKFGEAAEEGAPEAIGFKQIIREDFLVDGLGTEGGYQKYFNSIFMKVHHQPDVSAANLFHTLFEGIEGPCGSGMRNLTVEERVQLESDEDSGVSINAQMVPRAFKAVSDLCAQRAQEAGNPQDLTINPGDLLMAVQFSHLRELDKKNRRMRMHKRIAGTEGHALSEVHGQVLEFMTDRDRIRALKQQNIKIHNEARGVYDVDYDSPNDLVVAG